MKNKKYYRRMGPLATLLAVALLIAGVAGVYRMGWREGYLQAWTLAQPRGEDAPAPNAAPFTPWGGPLHRNFYPVHRGPLGRLASLLLVLLGLGIVFKALRHRSWHVHHAAQGAAPHPPQPPHASWHHGPWSHAPWPHGPWGCGPAAKTDDAERPPADEQVAKVKPEPDAD